MNSPFNAMSSPQTERAMSNPRMDKYCVLAQINGSELLAKNTSTYLFVNCKKRSQQSRTCLLTEKSNHRNHVLVCLLRDNHRNHVLVVLTVVAIMQSHMSGVLVSAITTISMSEAVYYGLRNHSKKGNHP